MRHTDNMGVDVGFDTLDYGYASMPPSVNNTLVHGERDLWCAVIAQAFVDIGAIVPLASGRKPEAPPVGGRHFDEAVRWLLRDKKNFTYICDLAGVSPHVIRQAARAFYGRAQLALGAMHSVKA